MANHLHQISMLLGAYRDEATIISYSLFFNIMANHLHQIGMLLGAYRDEATITLVTVDSVRVLTSNQSSLHKYPWGIQGEGEV